MENRLAPAPKSNLHPRNAHRDRYDFTVLTQALPELSGFLKQTDFGDTSIDFFNPEAVKMLNRALLMHHYDVEFWDIPAGYLCPPIPGRADYVHYAADVLAESTAFLGKKIIPTGPKITCLDVGTGANLIYPLLGHRVYGWTFIASEIDVAAIQNAEHILHKNNGLSGSISIRQQHKTTSIFAGILHKDEKIDLTFCNPPFHASAAEARAGSVRKLQNLTQKAVKNPVLNFGGNAHELWCEGGEERFLKTMIEESRTVGDQVLWFTTLVSKETTLKPVYQFLKKVGAREIKTIEMRQGQKKSRFVAWTFLSENQREVWINERWQGKYQ